MNSLVEIVVVENIELPTGPTTGYGVDNPLFHSESFRTLTHTARIFNPSSSHSSGHDIFGALGTSSNQTMASQMSDTYVTYMIPLDHFTGTTSKVVTVSDQLLVGSHSIIPLQIAHSTMVITRYPIGTPLLLRPNMSLPPGYNALNTSISIPTQHPSRGLKLFVPPGYIVTSHFVPTPIEVISVGPYVPPPTLYGGYKNPSPNGSKCTIHSVSSGFQILVGGKPQFGRNLNLGGNLKFGGNLKLEAITQFMDKV
jgi:hypothetical protein